MEILESILKWIIFNSIYGIVAITAIVYFISFGVKKIISKAPKPEIIAGFIFFIAIVTIPSIPRYQFENETLSQIEGKPWIKIINKTKWGDITEPLTWFNTPVGSVFLVMPNEISIGGFREVLIQYEQEPRVTITEPDCSDRTISFSVPDSEGTFRYTSNEAKQMTEEERKRYCEYNWSKEKQALMTEMLRQAK